MSGTLSAVPICTHQGFILLPPAVFLSICALRLMAPVVPADDDRQVQTMTTSVGVAGRRWARSLMSVFAMRVKAQGSAARAAFLRYPLILDQLSAVPAGNGQADRAETSCAIDSLPQAVILPSRSCRADALPAVNRKTRTRRGVVSSTQLQVATFKSLSEKNCQFLSLAMIRCVASKTAVSTFAYSPIVLVRSSDTSSLALKLPIHR
jgi:hypothetical protein